MEMEAAAIEQDVPPAPKGDQAVLLLGAPGLIGMSWWIWAWSKVDALIDTHVSTHGPLPASDLERAALYANGTPAEQQLSQDLENISGLYPWGSLPLILSTALALAGFLFAIRRSRRHAVLGIGLTTLLLVLSLRLFDTMTVALEILE